MGCSAYAQENDDHRTYALSEMPTGWIRVDREGGDPAWSAWHRANGRTAPEMLGI